MSLFNIMLQELAPDWVRARMLAVYLFVFQGSVTIGNRFTQADSEVEKQVLSHAIMPVEVKHYLYSRESLRF
jgi:hypothetical protein